MPNYHEHMHARTLSVIGILLLIIAIPVTVLFLRSSPQTIEQQAAGNTVSANPGDNLDQKVLGLNPGDTLVLSDGTYNGELHVEGKNGTSANPITIQAAHDGKAIIDGGGSVNHVIEVNNSSNIIVQGLIAQRSGSGVVAVLGTSNNVIVRRVTAHDAAAGNNHVFEAEFGPTNILFEDDAGWGNGRYIFSAYHASQITFRRCYAKWTSQSNFSPAPRAPFNVYGASNVTLENDIGAHGTPDQNSSDYFTADWQTSDGPPQDNATYLGVMFFGNWEGLWVNGSAGNNTVIKNSYFENNRKQGTFSTSTNHGDGIMWGTNNGTGGSVDTTTFVNNESGFSLHSSHSPTLTNNAFINNDTAITGSQNHAFTDFFGNKSLGTTIGSTDKQVDPGYNVAKYGKGAYLFVPSTSPLKGAGQNSADIGANILYEYSNGQLTNQALWPWPMEDRIKAETGVSVTWANAGGLWNTLDGVYSTSLSTPSPGMSQIPPVITPTAPSMPNPCLLTQTPTPTDTPVPGQTVTPASSPSPGLTVSPNPSISPPPPSGKPSVTPGKKNDTDDEKKKQVCHEEKESKGILGGVADLFNLRSKEHTHLVCNPEKVNPKKNNDMDKEHGEHKKSFREKFIEAVQTILSFLFPGLIPPPSAPVTSVVTPNPCDTPSPIVPTNTPVSGVSPSPVLTLSPSPQQTGMHHYEYVFPDGNLYVYDADNNFSLVKHVSIPTNSGVRGVVGNAQNHTLYISYGTDAGSGGHLLAYDLLSDKILWQQTYTHGIDSMAITPDGSKIYMPDGELMGDGKWYVESGATGQDTGVVIDTGTGTNDNGPHNTIVSLNGTHVYLGDRNLQHNGSNYFYVADTATNQITKKVGPFISGIRPFTINAQESLVYTTVTGFLGFQVGDLSSGKVLYTVDLTKLGFPNNPTGPTTPSHGIALSPDGKQLAVIDWPNDMVHLFDVTNTPMSAPIKIADSKFTKSMHHTESPCAYDCPADGWLEYSRDGKYLYVGDSGDVIDTSTNTSVINLNTLYNTRKMIEVDFQNNSVSFVPNNRASVGF